MLALHRDRSPAGIVSDEIHLFLARGVGDTYDVRVTTGA
jgi:hypothetical protein